MEIALNCGLGWLPDGAEDCLSVFVSHNLSSKDNSSSRRCRRPNSMILIQMTRNPPPNVEETKPLT